MENYFTEVLWVNIFMYIGYFTRMDGLYGSKGITWKKKKKINDPEQLRKTISLHITLGNIFFWMLTIF